MLTDLSCDPIHACSISIGVKHRADVSLYSTLNNPPPPKKKSTSVADSNGGILVAAVPLMLETTPQLTKVQFKKQ